MKLASIREITDIQKIETAENFELAIIDNGWSVVVEKDEYSTGQKVVYVQPGTWIPSKLCSAEKIGIYKGIKGSQLGVVKRSGVYSEGMIIPLDKLKNISEETDIEQTYNIQKWERPLSEEFSGVSRSVYPSYIEVPKYDHCQNLNNQIFNNHIDDQYEITTKLDGIPMTVYVKNGKVGVISNGVNFKETKTNYFWKLARDINIVERIKEFYEDNNKWNIAIHGVIVGEGIYGNPEKINGRRFFMHDIYDISNKEFLYPEKRHKLYISLSEGTLLDHLPVVSNRVTMPYIAKTMDELVSYADGPSIAPFTKRKGLVFKSYNSNFSFKVRSNLYSWANHL